MRFPGCRHIAAHRIGGQIKYVSVAARTQKDRVTEMALQFPGNQVARDNAPRFPVNNHHIKHFMAGIHGNLSHSHLTHKRTVGSQQQLLPSLAGRVKGSLHLHPSEGPVTEKSPYSRAKGTPCATHWSMMFPLTSAR